MKILSVLLVVVASLIVVHALDFESQIIAKKLEVGTRIEQLQILLQNSKLDLATRQLIKTQLSEVNSGCNKLHSSYEEVNHDAQALHERLDELSQNLGATPSCAFCTNFTNNITIWKNFPISRNFVCNTDCQFIRELLADGRNVMVDNFLDLFNSLDYSQLNATAKDIFFTNVLMALLKQTKTNPLQYVSHGTDHAVRVMNWNGQLYQIPTVAATLQSTYGTTANASIFMLMLNGLLHDCGYTPLDYILYSPSPPKWIHAVLGKWTNEVLLYEKTNNNLGERVLAYLAAKTNDDYVVDAFLEGIRYHNFDDQFCLWTAANNTRYTKMCAFDTTKNPIPPLVGEGIYYRTYTPATASSTPFIFTIRIADNLDFINTRLTTTQRSEKLMLWLWYLYKDQTVRNAVINNVNSAELAKVTDDAKERYRECVWGSDWKNDPEFQDGELMSVMKGCSTESFLHFYSNWMVGATAFDAKNFILYVNLTYTDKEELKFMYNPGPALYQINRMASSMNSLFVTNSTSFIDSVLVVLNETVPGMTNNSFPLKAFTKKPIYSTGGMTGTNVCGIYCSTLTPYLTNSPESCIAQIDGKYQQTTDESICNYTTFGTLPTFSDLNYNPNLVPNSQPSSGKLQCIGSSNDNKKKKDEKILAIVLPIIFGVTIIVVGVLVALSKKKHGYRPIE